MGDSKGINVWNVLHRKNLTVSKDKKDCGLERKMWGGIKREDDNRNREREKRRET